MTHLLYGIAVGGPYDRRPIAHHEAVMEVAFCDIERRVLVAQQGPTIAHPSVSFKAYVWQPALEEWRWDDRVRRSETLKRV